VQGKCETRKIAPLAQNSKRIKSIQVVQMRTQGNVKCRRLSIFATQYLLMCLLCPYENDRQQVSACTAILYMDTYIHFDLATYTDPWQHHNNTGMKFCLIYVFQFINFACVHVCMCAWCAWCACACVCVCARARARALVSDRGGASHS
jgi:hypothetical protein